MLINDEFQLSPPLLPHFLDSFKLIFESLCQLQTKLLRCIVWLGLVYIQRWCAFGIWVSNLMLRMKFIAIWYCVIKKIKRKPGTPSFVDISKDASTNFVSTWLEKSSLSPRSALPSLLFNGKLQNTCFAQNKSFPNDDMCHCRHMTIMLFI